MDAVDGCAVTVIAALEAESIPYMLVGAYSSSAFGIPRATQDVDVVISIQTEPAFAAAVRRMSEHFDFDPQITFETITGSRRHILTARANPAIKVELFLLGDDAFMQQRFQRRIKAPVPQLEQGVCVPTPEDVVVQKIRWGRSKDLDDARDVLAVQTLAALDMPYIEHWCAQHGTLKRLHAVIASIPEDLR